MSSNDVFSAIMGKLDKLEVVDDLAKILKFVQEKIDVLAKKVSTLEEKNFELTENVEILRSSAKRNNIILYNLGESENSSNDLKKQVIKILSETTKVQLEDSDICTVHRIGIEKAGKIRPVRIKFDSLIKKMSVARNFSKFKTSKFNASLDYTTEVLKKRRMLTPKMHEARKNGSHATLVGKYLYINGKRLLTADTPVFNSHKLETPSTSEDSDPSPKFKTASNKRSKKKNR